jgi:hypothetical protein
VTVSDDSAVAPTRESTTGTPATYERGRLAVLGLSGAPSPDQKVLSA